MKKCFSFISICFFSMSLYCTNTTKKGIPDSAKSTIDTTYVEDFKEWLALRMVGVVRSNKFSITNKISNQNLQYSINSNLNMGLGASYKGIAIELLYKPPGLDNDSKLYGKSKQFSIATRANTRKFILDVYYMQNKGFYTSKKYNFTGNTTIASDHVRRSDIENYSGGFNFLYVFNNKKFSCSAPYSLTQRQRKSAGSFLLGTYGLIYSISSDSVIIPDTMVTNFKPEIQFKNASSITWGIAAGYTYTVVFGKNWFANLTTVPGISIQELYTENGLTGKAYNNIALGLSMQTKFAFGYNKKRYFIGISAAWNNYLLSGSASSKMNYRFGYFRFYYGHRFQIKNGNKSFRQKMSYFYS